MLASLLLGSLLLTWVPCLGCPGKGPRWADASGQQTSKELLRDLSRATKQDPASAIPTLDLLIERFETADEKERKSITRGIEGMFRARKDSEEGVDQLFVAAAAALSAMGEEGDEALMRSTKLKHLRARPVVLATLIESLGQQARVEVLDTVLDHLSIDSDKAEMTVPVSVAALRAVRRFREAPAKVRKQLVERLVRDYTELDRRFEAKRESDRPDPGLELAFNSLEVPFLQALQELTGESCRSAPDWREWWEEHRNLDWDAGRVDREDEGDGRDGKRDETTRAA